MPFDDIRSLLYPLGWCASILFFSRFYIQWFKSEKRGISYVTPIFWRLSFSANCLMALHGFLQMQLPVLLIQTINSIISWRNLELIKEKKRKIGQVIFFMVFVFAFVFISFLWIHPFTWMVSKVSLGFNWHLFGLVGMALFASRFWIQWIQAEKKKLSHLSKSFWLLSFFGALFSFIYFAKLHDAVQIVSFGLGIIPYARNLILQRRKPEIKKGHFFFVAGEKSGDLLGEKLISSLKTKSDFSLSGVGGKLMQEAGMKVFLPLERLNVMGFTDVLKALPRIAFSFHQIKKKILNEQPEKVILIDYPEFNMYLAKKLRKKGYKGKIIHYVSPTVWAWRKKRADKLAKSCDALLSIFPFEKSYYAHTKLPVIYVGHPLATTLKNSINKVDKNILSIFPGSRKEVVLRNLPMQLDAAKNWIKEKGFKLAVSVASDELETFIKQELKKRELTAEIFSFENRYEMMEKSGVALATSGTVTLELSLHQVPAVVTYSLSAINDFLGRHIFKIHLPSYCIVNIIAGKQIYPEFIGKRIDVNALTMSLERVFGEREGIKKELLAIKKVLGQTEASEEAARVVAEI